MSTYAERKTKEARAVVNAIRECTGLPLEYISFIDDGVYCYDDRSRRYLIVYYDWKLGDERFAIVRSVLRIRKGARRWGWLPNGQSSTNTKEIYWWDERDMHVRLPREVT